MNIDASDTVRRIAWKEIFPWLIIFQSFRVAFCTRIILLALASVCLVDLGWNTLAQVIQPDMAAKIDFGPLGALKQPYPEGPPVESNVYPINHESVLGVTVMPWVELFGGSHDADNPLSFRRGLYLTLGGLWTIALWALFGGAISRIAAVKLARNEVVGLRASVRFAAGKWLSYAVAPLVPIGVVIVISLFAKLVGLFMLADFGMLIACIVWPIVLLFGFLSAILLTGLLVGWPLMWATISVQGEDGFDSLSRMFSYVYQRPLYYLFYCVIALLFGTLCWVAVSYFAIMTVELSYTATELTAGAAHVEKIKEAAPTATIGDAPATALIGLWNSLVSTIGLAVMYGFFWTAMTAIYLLMRRAVDHCEMDEVYIGDAADTYDLPDLSSES